MKKLVCASDVEALAAKGERILYVDHNTIVTPAAKDLIKELGITMQQSAAPAALDGNSGPTIDSELVYQVLQALISKSGVGGCPEAVMLPPYIAEQDTSGLRVVRGNSVLTQPVAGCREQNVRVRSLDNSGCPDNGPGIMEISQGSYCTSHTRPQSLIVVDGCLDVEVAGRRYSANTGDVITVPAGTQVVYQAAKQAKIFYVNQ